MKEPLGSKVALIEALENPSLFRIEFTNDVRAKEMRWVIFTESKRGCIGKIIFTLEKDGKSAHVKSLAINKEWRGCGLAKILYLACLSTLQELKVEELHLEAEEDSRRHGKLVGMYENWGFEEKKDSKVLLLYNNNECFRKVPMMLSFYKRTFFPVRPDSNTWFCMIALTTSDGTSVIASEDGVIEVRRDKAKKSLWQTLLGSNGEIFLRSMHGKFLCVEETGNVLADRQLNSTWETFQVVPHSTSTSPSKLSSSHGSVFVGGGRGGIALKNFHGGYLGIDASSNKVVSSREPIPWDGDLKSLVCNKSDAKPLFIKIMRKYQTKAFVQKEQAKYGDFQHACMSIPDACNALLTLIADESPCQSWIFRYMLGTAEILREEGHPDWLQLSAFLRGFGLLFLLWCDEEDTMLRSIKPMEWMQKMSTWILDIPIPQGIENPELNAYNADHVELSSSKDSSVLLTLQYGMENMTLPWTTDEYLYRVLEFNKNTLPVEALQVIRYWSLKLWHETNHYENICAPQDFETKEWLHAVENCRKMSSKQIESVSVDRLMPYYMGLTEKYLPSTLQW